MSRGSYNYPPKQKNYSCHHIAYPYSNYRGELEHTRYQHNQALLIPALNTRHNIGYLTVHSLLDYAYGPPPKPRYMLMADCVDFMESLDRFEPRIDRLGKVIDFYFDEAETSTSSETAQQALDIATHYAMQKWIVEEGGESFVQEQQQYWQREAA
jgi:hypothetical protein